MKIFNKKLFLLLFTGILIISITGCGPNKYKDKVKGSLAKQYNETFEIKESKLGYGTDFLFFKPNVWYTFLVYPINNPEELFTASIGVYPEETGVSNDLLIKLFEEEMRNQIKKDLNLNNNCSLYIYPSFPLSLNEVYYRTGNKDIDICDYFNNFNKYESEYNFHIYIDESKLNELSYQNLEKMVQNLGNITADIRLYKADRELIDKVNQINEVPPDFRHYSCNVQEIYQSENKLGMFRIINGELNITESEFTEIITGQCKDNVSKYFNN